MKKLAIIVVVLTLGFSIGSSQNLTVSTSFNQDYLKYYNQINKAKKALIDGGYGQAAAAYFLAFQKYEFAFATDCYNAVEVAALVKNDALLLAFGRKALESGISLQALATIKNVKVSASWKTLEAEAPTLKEKYLKRINQSVKTKITAIHKAHQKKKKKYFKKGKTPSIKKLIKWDIFLQAQYDQIVSITKEHGFPGERRIGLDDNTFSSTIAVDILSDYFARSHAWELDFLKEEINKGNIKNEAFAKLADYQNKYSQESVVPTPCYGYQHDACEEEEKENRRRAIRLLSSEAQAAFRKVKVITVF